MRLYLVGTLAAFLMVGCGSSSNPQQLEKTTKLAGVAVDDLIVNGVVRAYAASTTEELVKSRTDKVDGSYTLDVPYDGVVIIEVTCDTESRMKNPLTGELRQCIQDLKLHSAATVAPETKEIKVNISPISELVVRQMKERGAVTKENLEAAQENIGEMFSFDPLGESPVENPQYSKVIGAIHKMADAKADVTILDIIDDLSEDYEDGVAGNEEESVISKDFADAMVAVGANNKLTKNDGEYIPIVKQEEDKKKLEDEAKKKAEEDKKKADEEAKKKAEEDKKKLEEEKKKAEEEAEKKRLEEEQKANIVLSKQFFNDLRTQAMSVVDYQNSGTPGFLDDEAKNLGTALENITMDSKTAGNYAVGIVTDILDLVDKNSTGDTNNVDDTTSIVYVKDSSILWSYSILENDDEKYKGTVTLPSENLKDISLKSYTGTLNVKFDGTVPLEGDAFGGDDEDYSTTTKEPDQNRETRALVSDAQTLKADISLIRKDYGSDFVLSNVSLLSQGTLLALTDFTLSAYYTFNEKDEVDVKHVTFGGVSISGKVGTYTVSGKLEIPEYVQNDSLDSKSFMEDEYKTYVYAGGFCLDEHNQRMNLSDGIVTYTDASDAEHQLTANRWGGFYANIDGNVENLDSDDQRYGSSGGVAPDLYADGNYSKYIGLKFDNVSLQSDSCQNIALEHFGVEVVDGNTNVYGQIFCIEGENRREFDMQQDENGEYISEVTASFTDANGVSHPFDVRGGSINTQYNGNSENIALDSGRENIFPNEQGFIDFERITIESSCETPILNQLQFSFEPENDSKGEMSLYTRIDGSFSCKDDSMNPYISEGTITYTDKSGTTHQSNNDNFYNEGLHYDHGNFYGRIKGNVEALSINMGRKNYNAARFIYTVEADNIKITSNSCANPQLDYLDIGLDHDEKIFNSGYLPKKVVFDGNITNSATGGYISGNVTVDWLNAKTMSLIENSTDKPLVDISVTGTIKMPEQPKMILNLGYKNSVNQDNDFTFNYAYGATSITGTGDFDKDMRNGDIVLTSHHGLRAVIKIVNGDVIYGSQSAVTRNGVVVGTLEGRQGIPVILYTDGTFESLP